MRRLSLFVFCLLGALTLTARPEIVPAPASMEVLEGVFQVRGASFSIDKNVPSEAVAAINDFSQTLAMVSGKKACKNKPGFHFCLDKSLPAEGYSLEIRPDGVSVKASAFSGFFYAIQSIKQLLPVEVYGSVRAPKAGWTLPCLNVYDFPRFAYRGLLLDSCRHFFTVEEVKRVLDMMAVHKLNRFHWHLTEDQGWRIEIKKYPRLTEIGSRRAGTQIFRRNEMDGIPYGGFYTQDEIREVVAYAAARGITVIPELDLPGHTLAALTAYPELGCTGGPYEVSPYWGVMKDVLCVGREETFTFLEDVLKEIMDLFPSEYIHIGGDECPKVRWKECPRCQALIDSLGLKDTDEFTKEHYLQNYVTARIQKFLSSYGRRIIGWDEILEGELAPGATVMSWRGTKGGIKAAGLGFDIIMAPSSYCYINHYQTKERDKEPRRQRHYLPIEKCYSFEPMDGMPEGSEVHLLGVQACLWTEHIKTPVDLEYQMLPRLSAISEVQWCPKGTKDWDRFRGSLEHMTDIYSVMGFTWCKALWGLIGLPGHELPARSAAELDTLDFRKVPYMEQ